ncbi:MAG: hypothetical protein AAF995_02985 [Planctomycetota bacterium]
MSIARATRPTAFHFTRLLAAALVCAAATGAALADIPAALSRATTVSSGDRDEIADHIAEHAESLGGGDVARSRNARNALLEPLGRGDVSAAFRQAYARALQPTIDRLTSSADPLTQLTGLRLAGASASEAGVRTLTGYLTSEDDGLRMFAIGRLERALGTLGTPSGVLGAAATEREAIDALGGLIERDQNPRMADAAARALAPATRLTDPELLALRQQAIRTLSDASGNRLAGLDHREVSRQELATAVRAVAIVRLAVADPNNPPTREASIAATRLGGDALGLVLAMVRSGAAPADRTLLVQLTQAAETAVYFGRFGFARAANGDVSSIQQTALGSLIEQADDGRYRNEVIRLLGPASAPVREMGLDADRFIRDI